MSLAKTLARRAVKSAPVMRLLGRFRPPGSPAFLTHRFKPTAQDPSPAYPVDVLDELLRRLKRAGFAFAPLHELLDRAQRGGRPVRDAVAFTVDDGYADFAELALPVLTAYACPATVFLATGPVDGTAWFWWDQVDYIVRRTEARSVSALVAPWRVAASWEAGEWEKQQAVERLCEQLKLVPTRAMRALVRALASEARVELPQSAPDEYRMLTWDQVREAGNHGVTFGPHTVTHPVLSRCDDAEAANEIIGSAARLRAMSVLTCPVFCFPNGTPTDFGPRELELVTRAGLCAAVSTSPGYIIPVAAGADARVAFPRFHLPESVHGALRVTSAYDVRLARVFGAFGLAAGARD